MPNQSARNVSVSRDDTSRIWTHRSATAADSTDNSTLITGAKALAMMPPPGTKQAFSANYLIGVGGTQQMKFRFHVRRAAGSENNATLRGVLVGWALPWLEKVEPPLTAAPKWPKGQVVFETTSTGILIGASTSVNLHPVTQEAAASQTFYEADGITPSAIDADLSAGGNGTNYQITNGNGSGRQASITLDTFNFAALMWFLTDFSVAFDEVVVSAERLG